MSHLSVQIKFDSFLQACIITFKNKVQLLILISMNKCIAFLKFLNKCCTVIIFIYFHQRYFIFLNAPWYINHHRIHEDLQMNTVLSEIKELNTKYLRELENHANALAVNLLDNRETTRRLKRYTALTLPDSPE
jgi:hypothetical protein